MQDTADKVLVFDRLKDSLTAMKGRTQPSDLHAAHHRAENGALTAKEIGRMWQARDAEERTRWDLEAAVKNKPFPYAHGISSNESDESRTAYRLLLTFAAPPAESGRGAAVARLLGLKKNATEGAWKGSVATRGKIDSGDCDSWIPAERVKGGFMSVVTRSLVDFGTGSARRTQVRRLKCVCVSDRSNGKPIGYTTR